MMPIVKYIFYMGKFSINIHERVSKADNIIEPDVYNAVCYSVIDLGTSVIPSRRKKHGSVDRRINISFEILDLINERGKYPSIGKTYRISSWPDSPLIRHLEGWRGRRFSREDFNEGDFDFIKLIGKKCRLIVNIFHDEQNKRIPYIQDIMTKAKGLRLPNGVQNPCYFSLDDFHEENFLSCPEWAKIEIQKSNEYRRLKSLSTIDSFLENA